MGKGQDGGGGGCVSTCPDALMWVCLALYSRLRLRQVGGPIWNQPIHDPEFVDAMLAEAAHGLHPHPHRLPECDAGSNAAETVERSRQRMLGVLRSIAFEVCGARGLSCSRLCV